MINVYDAILSDPAYFKQLSVKGMLWVNYHCPQTEDWVNLYSPFNFIIYTISGKKLLSSVDKSETLTEGSLIFLKKGAIRHTRFFESGWHVIVFCIPDNYLQQSFNEYQPQSPRHSIPPPLLNDAFIDIDTNNTTHAFFYSMLPYFIQATPPPETLLELKCRELMFNIFSQQANQPLIAYINSLNKGKNAVLAEVMEANYMYNLSLEEFARINQRSLTAFKKDFMEVFHTSPGKWLIQRRLEYAEQLLITSDKSITEIACDSGFESVTHFGRVFKEKFNIAPLQYRKRATTNQ
ncbi:MAG: AraC family transcriptional regulator [Chitinophagaceae bacterium]